MKQNKVNHLRIIALLSLTATVLCAGAFSYAWYINNKTVNTSGDVSVETSSNLQICDASRGGFSTGFTMKRKSSYNFVDLTSDGNRFYNPTSLGTDYSSPEAFSSFTDVTHEREVTKGEYSFYIFLDLKIRSSVNCDVYLSSNSYVQPKELTTMEDCEANPQNYSSESTDDNYYMKKFYRPSANGVFSQDGIAGAARVAFYSVENVPVVTSSNYQNYYILSGSDYVSAEDTSYSYEENYYRLVDDEYVLVPNVYSDLTLNKYDCFYTDSLGLDHSAYITQNGSNKFDASVAYFTKELTLLNVWIPNPQYQLSRNSTNTFSLNGNIEDGYGYAKSSSSSDVTEMNYYSSTDYLEKKVSVGNCLAQNEEGNNRFNGSAPLLSFTDTSEPQELVAKIWFEGTDRESYPYLDGGQVNYNLSFVGLAKKTVKGEISSAEQNSFTFDSTNRSIANLPVDGSYEYSTNGAQWETYNSDTAFGYQRVDETTYLYEVTSDIEEEYALDNNSSSYVTARTKKYSWNRDNKQMPFIDLGDDSYQIMVRKKETETSLASDPIWITLANTEDMSLPQDEAIEI